MCAIISSYRPASSASPATNTSLSRLVLSSCAGACGAAASLSVAWQRGSSGRRGRAWPSATASRREASLSSCSAKAAPREARQLSARCSARPWAATASLRGARRVGPSCPAPAWSAATASRKDTLRSSCSGAAVHPRPPPCHASLGRPASSRCCCAARRRSAARRFVRREPPRPGGRGTRKRTSGGILWPGRRGPAPARACRSAAQPPHRPAGRSRQR
mmetsp:Transcript_117140/g.378043  ORF Transcript_117140/g.378043 Transcript_117140/m.378043 type:complete len:218 (-) Transcript_117140:90-743(-)